MKVITQHLFIFNGKQFRLLQLTSLSKLDCTFIGSERNSNGENILASSANNNKFTEKSRTVGKSFINELNKRGPK